jgi:hypothetical protein
MTLGIMQPYFLPYLGYYSLIKNTDKWIVFDEVQYIRHGWIDRNRILKPGEGWQYISVPLQKHNRETLIKDIKIRNEDWRGQLLRQIEHYKKAPYYASAIEVLNKAFAIDTDSITLLNTHILKETCNYLGMAFNAEIFSDIQLNMEQVNDAGEWALYISKALNAGTYINPPGGMEIFDKQKFQNAQVELKFLKINLNPYPQRGKEFEPGLSILDAMMFNNAASINQMLDDYQILT